MQPIVAQRLAAVCRPVVYKDTYEDASDENQRCLGKRMSRQAFGICPKIREVGELTSRVRPGAEHLHEMAANRRRRGLLIPGIEDHRSLQMSVLKSCLLGASDAYRTVMINP